jgi:hypothetical protein
MRQLAGAAQVEAPFNADLNGRNHRPSRLPVDFH